MQTSSASRSGTMQTPISHKQLMGKAASLHAIIENFNGYIWSIDKNLHYIVLNTKLQNKIKEISGVLVLPGDKALDIVELLDASKKVEWEKIYKSGFKGTSQRFVQEFTLEEKVAYFEITINPIQENGKITGLSCFAHDVTEEIINTQNRKKTEEALLLSELKFRSLIENSTDIITMANAEGYIF